MPKAWTAAPSRSCSTLSTDPLRAVTAGAALDDLERLEAELDATVLPPAGAAPKRTLAPPCYNKRRPCTARPWQLV